MLDSQFYACDSMCAIAVICYRSSLHLSTCLSHDDDDDEGRINWR